METFIKLGDKGRQVKEVQQLLKVHKCFDYPTFTGNFGPVTEAGVKKFQEKNKLPVTGIVNDKTMAALVAKIDTDIVVPKNDVDNKLADYGTYASKEGLVLHRQYMDSDQYVNTYPKISFKSFFLHHSAGGHSAVAMGNMWNTDDRGRIATPYGISGKSTKGDTSIDGQVIEFFPDGYFGWNIGTNQNFEKVAKSIGVELCNYGALTTKKDKYYNYVNTLMPADQVCKLDKPFKGKLYWHNYTDAQIESLRLLILHVKTIYPDIDFNKGLPGLLKAGVDPHKAFDYQEKCDKGLEEGIWTHTNVRKDKMDCYPHPKLVEMLKNL